MDKETAQIVIDRDAMIDKGQSFLRELIMKNIEGKRTYLYTLLLIVFVASGFTITIHDYVDKWAILISVVLYLVSAIVTCIYLSFLLIREGNSLDNQLKFTNQQKKDLVEAVSTGKIKDFETFESFREEKSQAELEFKKDNLKNVSDVWFWLINILFTLGTIVLLAGYVLYQYCQGY